MPSPIYFYLFLLVIYFLIFQPLSATSLELADKVIENQKEVHRMTFLSPYVLPVAQVFEVLKFIQFLMLFENQFLDTSSNFELKNRSMIAFTDLFLFIFAGYLFFFSTTLSATSFGAG